MRKTLALTLSVSVLFFDQLTKFWALTHLIPYESKSVFPWLNWTLAFNTGSAFSFLANAGAWHLWFFAGFSAIVSIGLVIWICRLENTSYGFKQMLALALILGGALGNLIDRIRMGFVIDFIDIHHKTLHWPVFNVADSAICIGGIWLAWLWIREQHQ